MPGISVNGLSSGIDTGALIDALTASQKRRIATMEGRIGAAAGRQDALAGLSDALSRVRQALTRVSDPGLFGPGGPDAAEIRLRMAELVDAHNAARETVR
ncbi:MAG: hypothetical protein HUU15_16385, partial [Candidatus Brocadiae bacterium]|nr:hypothetical protein [Candidatus Brocadiia bacterium]